MSPLVHGFDPPERFVAGTVGPPGSRTFFLQARSGTRLVSVALEKQQVSALAERIDELLDEVMASELNEAMIPAVAPLGLEDADRHRDLRAALRSPRLDLLALDRLGLVSLRLDVARAHHRHADVAV